MKRIIVFLFVLLSVGVVSAQDEFNWNGTDRFTVLIMGIDRRPTEGGSLTFRSDTTMLASINPLNNRAGVLSIPRTIHLALPDTGELVPIHTLLIRGEVRQEGYGPELVRQTIQHNLGIYIDAMCWLTSMGLFRWWMPSAVSKSHLIIRLMTPPILI